MRFSVWPHPHGTWDDLVDLCTHAEATGWDGLWYADHFMPNQANTGVPTNECWTTLAALAARVPRVRVGALVSGNTYRHPAVLAKMAANLDRLSGGRAVLGLGAGWQENEHTAYGLPFPSLRERLERLEEACELIRGLFENERTTSRGRHYELVDAPLEPKPIQRPLPLLVGGGGEKVTLRIVARLADEWNTWGTPDVLRHKIGVLEKHCEEVGRDPAAVQRSAVALVDLRDEPADAQDAGGRPLLAGTAEQLREQMAAYAAAGVDEFIVPDFTLGGGQRRKDALDRFLGEVAASFR